jgi:hypothetical protein
MKLSGLTQTQVDANSLQALGDAVNAARLSWYRDVGDGMWFKEQRGEIAAGTWLRAVEELKKENPWPHGYAAKGASNAEVGN